MIIPMWLSQLNFIVVVCWFIGHVGATLTGLRAGGRLGSQHTDDCVQAASPNCQQMDDCVHNLQRAQMTKLPSTGANNSAVDSCLTCWPQYDHRGFTINERNTPSSWHHLRSQISNSFGGSYAHIGHKVQALSFGIQVGTGVLLLVNMLRLQAIAHQPDCSESGGVLGGLAGLAGLGGNDGPNGPNGLDWSVGRGSRDG